MKNYSVQEMIEYNHIISQQLMEICQPLFSNFGFTSFGYTKIFSNGSRIILETNKEWLRAYGELDFSEQNDGSSPLIDNVLQALSNAHSQEFHAHLLTAGKPKNKLHEFLTSLDLWNCLSIYVPMNESIEIFHLATSQDNGAVLDFYFNKKDLLQRFIYYFRDKLDGLNVKKAPCIFDKIFLGIFSKSSSLHKDSNIQKKISDFVKQTTIDRFYLKTHDRFITLREAQCLHYLVLGKSYKEIAYYLTISPRTVESFINSLKVKTSSYSKADLVKIGHQNYIGSYNFISLTSKKESESYI